MLALLRYRSRAYRATFWLLTLLLCAGSLATPAPDAYLCDPVSLLISVAISAAISGATYGLQRLLTKTPRRQIGKRDGSTLITDSELGVTIPEVYGARHPDDDLGGYRLAGNIIDASSIRKVTTTSTVETGGKGAPKQKVDTTRYYQDLDIAFSRGPVRFLKIWFVGASGMKLVYDVTGYATETGIIDPAFPVESPYDYFLLPDPETPDTNPTDRYSLVPVPDAEDVIEVQLLNGIHARLYAGNETQLPDPLFESVHGAGEVPAYRGLGHIVFENVDISEGHPNVLALVEHAEAETLGGIFALRAARAGLSSSDYDFTDLDATPVRGFPVSGQQAPRSDMELLARVYRADFYEGADGKITGALLSDTVVETLDADYIGSSENGLAVGVQARPKDEFDLPFRLNLTASDPTNNFEAVEKHATRQITTSTRHSPLELPLTLTPAELQRIANRELQEMWQAQGSFTFQTTHRYRSILPSQKIAVPVGGTLRDMRVREIRGSVPGYLHFTCTPADGVILEDAGASATASYTQTPSVPANTIITLIDVPRVHSPQDTPGFMWAPVQRDYASGEWSGASLYVDKGSGYQYVDTATAPALLGRVVGSALADVPGGWSEGSWDATSSVTVDFFGTREPETLTEAQALDEPYAFAVGDEVVIIRSWSAVGGHPNRWTGTNMQRRLKGTDSTGHVTGERVVLLDSAVRFVRVDESEVGVTRNYKAVTLAPTTPQRIEDAAEVAFEWTGATIEVDQTIPGTFTADTLDAVNGDIDSIVSADIETGQVRIGTGGTVLTKMLKGSVTIDPASVAAGVVSSQTFTLTGAVVGDALQLNPPAAGLTAGLIVLQSFVSAANTVTVLFQNTTGAPIDEPSASWTYLLIRS
jgi:hypothetical protein